MSSISWASSASAAASRAEIPGQRATISSSGSPSRCGSAPHSVSVMNGITGWSSRRYVSSAETSAHHVASRASAGTDSSASRTLANSTPQSQNSFQIES